MLLQVQFWLLQDQDVAAGSILVVAGSLCYDIGWNQRGSVASYREPFDSVTLNDMAILDADSFLESWVVKIPIYYLKHDQFLNNYDVVF